MKKKWKSAALAWVLTLTLAVGAAPAIAYAQEPGETQNTTETQITPDQSDAEEQPDVTDEVGTPEESGDTNIEEKASEEVAEEATEEPEVETQAEENLLTYSGHVQTYGDLKAVKDGAALGTTGESKRMEALVVNKGEALKDVEGEIMYRVHVQTYGNQKWMKTGEKAGTTGQSKRLEAIQMYLTGDLAEQYDIYYSTHCQTFGWTKWVKGSDQDSSWCGTQGLSKRIEAIKIVLVKKDGGEVPKDEGNFSLISNKQTPSVTYSGHQQTYGDLQAVSNGKVLGVTGKSKRLEALKIQLGQSDYTGSITYRAHVQTYGWQDWVSDGALAGTTGQSKRLEAVEIKLCGDMEKYYDVWYRVHIQHHGWLGWAKNGESAGSAGLSYRLEAIQIQIVPKNTTAPGAHSNYFVKKTPAQERVDNGAQGVYNQVGKNLYNCFNWCVKNIRYYSISGGAPSGYTNPQWYAVWGFEQHRGDCRTYAATFYQLAKGLGYNARYVYGYVPRAGGGMVDHAWVEIDEGGTTYVYDPDFQYETGRNGFKFRYKTSGTWRYSNYHYE